MKVLHTIATLESSAGGPARSVPQLASAMLKSGNQVGLWTPERGSHALADMTEKASSTIQVFQGDFTSALNDFGVPDLVHDHGIWQQCHRIVNKLCKKHEIPCIVSPRGMLEPWSLNHKKWKKKLAWWFYQKRGLQASIAIHATAEHEAANVKQIGLKVPIFVVPNGAALPPNIENVSILEKRSANATNKKTALFLSRIQSKKGIPLLIEAWSRLMPKDWKMQVIGPDEDDHLFELKKLVKRYNLESVWSFEDSLEGEAKWDVMRQADLFILPSHSENFGIVVAEALACGTPVITTKGTPWQILDKERCGWWTEISVEGIEKALGEATGQPREVLAEMGARGRKIVEEQFSWDKIAVEMIACYKWILGRGDKPNCVIDD